MKSPAAPVVVPQLLVADPMAVQFVDHRPESIQLKELQEMADESEQVSELAQLQSMADRYTSQQPSIIQKKTNNTGLPDPLKSGIENLSGYAMDDVKVHYNSDKPAQLHAHAYAQGTDIHLGSGQEKHLPHEAWHVVQQKQGRVKPTLQMKGQVNVNDDAGLEKEADVMGEAAMNQKNVQQPKTDNKPLFQKAKRSFHNTVQRLAVNLQNEDDVVNKLVSYAQQTLGMNDQVVDSIAAGAKTLGSHENIYLFGHGGSSQIDLEENDLFARINMVDLAQSMNEHLIFPEDYDGCIYLIGCHTNSLINELKSQLDELSGKNLDIRGTYEKLQTTDNDEIVHRNPSESPEEESMRAHADLLRSYYPKLISLRNMRRFGRRALLDATKVEDKEGIGDAFIVAYEQNKIIKAEFQKINLVIDRLKGAMAPKLKGRLSGFESIHNVYKTAGETQSTITANFLKYLEKHEANKAKQQEERENLDEFDVALALETAALMNVEYDGLSMEVQVTAIMIQAHDSPDVMKSKPFALDQMEGPLKPTEDAQQAQQEPEGQNENEGAPEAQGGIGWNQVLIVGGIAALLFTINFLRKRH